MERYGENRPLADTDHPEGPAVTCSNGTFIGKEKNEVCSFKGIPYALPPVGKLRWKPPVPAEKDGGTYEAFYFGKSGIQTDAETERASLYVQGEDCLTLNVWTSDKTETEGKPVMVFIPGGAYGWGGSADPLYDGQNFIEAHPDVILVTVNYRIGLMGFIDFSAVKGGEEYSRSGNLGLLDQICALQWVRDNIRGFGGDPKNVTLFGESAGGGSVSLLPLIDEAKGLFRRVIAQSGSIALTFSREECQSLTAKLMEETNAKTMEDLLALTEEELMELNKELNDYNNFPERDGVTVPEDLYAAYREGKSSGIDMMIGTNADEVRYWIGEVGGYRIYRVAGLLLYRSMLDSLPEKEQNYVRAFMELSDDEMVWNSTELFNDWIFRVPAIFQAAEHAKNGGRAYMYYWTKESAIPHYGACHAVELAYIFGNLDDTIYTGERADPALSARVQEMWVNFAKTGNPGTKAVNWEPYEPALRKTMILGDRIHMVSDPLAQQRILVEPLLHHEFNGYYKLFDYALDALRKDFFRVVAYLIFAEGIGFIFYRIFKWRKKRKKRILSHSPDSGNMVGAVR